MKARHPSSFSLQPFEAYCPRQDGQCALLLSVRGLPEAGGDDRRPGSAERVAGGDCGQQDRTGRV